MDCSPLSMGFSRQEYWSGLPFPPPGGSPGTEPQLSCIAGRIFNIWATREAPLVLIGQPFTPENLMSCFWSSLNFLFLFAGLFEFLIKNNTLSTIFISTLFFLLTDNSTCHHLTWFIIFTYIFHHHYILGNFSLSTLYLLPRGLSALSIYFSNSWKHFSLNFAIYDLFGENLSMG